LQNGNHINIDGQKFYDLDEGKGGGGAIDFTIHVLGCNFKDAISWLKSRFGSEEIVDEIAISARNEAKQQVEHAEKKDFIPPMRDDAKWPQARSYLQSRGIEIREPTQTIYADSKGNIAFLGKRSAELVGTGKNAFKGLSAGSVKNSSGFIAGNWENAEKIALVESAIDALSYVEMYPKQAALSTAGTPTEGFLKKFFAWSRRLGKMPILAFDNDEAGMNFFQKARAIAKEVFFANANVDDSYIRAMVGEAEPRFKDWNDELLFKRSQEQSQLHETEIESDTSFFPEDY